jgi:hypothetical protein
MSGFRRSAGGDLRDGLRCERATRTADGLEQDRTINEGPQQKSSAERRRGRVDDVQSARSMFAATGSNLNSYCQLCAPLVPRARPMGQLI